MSTLAVPIPPSRTRPKTLAELLDGLGNVPPERVRADPPPGTATERDVIDVEAREDRLCELVDGTLVEKAMGFWESVLAMLLVRILGRFVDDHDLGVISGPDGMIRLFPGMIRLPDVAFISWERLAAVKGPRQAVTDAVPDLAIEVLSAGNTAGEMERKVRDYFAAGVRLVWLVDPHDRNVRVYRSPNEVGLLRVGDAVNGGDVLRGFSIELRELFARLDQQGKA